MALFCVHLTWCPVLLLCSMVIGLKLDSIPSYFLDYFVVPGHTNIFLGISKILFRFILFLFPAYLLFISIISLIVFDTVGLFITSDLFYHLSAWIKFYLRMRKTRFPFYGELVIKGRKHFPTSKVLLSLHTQSRILERGSNIANFYTLPSFLLVGGIILVASNFASIKMVHVIPMPWYLAMPFFSITLSIIIQILFPWASKIHEQSWEFLRNFHLLHSYHKYWARKVRAERPFRFTFGSFFIAKKSTQMTFMVCIFDVTIDALLLKL